MATIDYDEAARVRYLGEAIRRGRALRGLSQRELARRAGVSQGTVSLLERGGTAPTWVVIDRISVALGLGLGWFLGEGR